MIVVKHKLLLYVEDYPVIQKIYLSTLEKRGFDVEVASDGKEALDKTSSKNYDLILLDLLLPGMSGLEFLSEFRKNNRPGEVVVLTDFDDVEAVDEAKRLGVKHYWMRVEKTPHELADDLEEVVNNLPDSDS